MKEATADQIKTIIRRMIGLFLIFCLPVPFFGFALMVLGVMLIATDIADWLARPFSQLFWSNQQSQPRPTYSQANALIYQGKFAEAEQAYEKIIESFPQEQKAHAERLRIVAVEVGDFTRANELYEESMLLLKNKEDQNQLTTLYRSYQKNAGRHIRIAATPPPACVENQ